MDSWRTISVALRADTSQYQAGLSSASKQTTAFGADVERVQERMGSGWKPTSQALREVDNSLLATRNRLTDLSGKLDQTGSQLTRGLTVPLALAGAASFKLAKDFGTAFTQMATLAGVPVSELEGLKRSVLDLAGETAQSPLALADALYQIYSSGVPASEAVSVLEASARASAIGMGDAAGIANALTSAINVYGAESLTAAQAADQLTAAVALGKGEAAAFAPQLGNLLPLAKELGVSFETTVGSLAFLTRTNGDAARSSTMLEGVLRKLIKPTTAGAEALDLAGGSALRLKEIVAEEGLPAGLAYLEDAFAGNSRAMAKFFDDSEGYVGVLQLLDEDGKAWADTLTAMGESQGLVAEGMAILQDTDEFRASQALAELQVVAVELGTALMPILTKIAGGIAGLASVFSGLPGPVQMGLIVLGLFAAALGPIVSLAGNAAKAIALFSAAMNAKALDSFRLGLMGLVESGAGVSNMVGGLIASVGGLGVVLGAAGGIAAGAALIWWDYSAQAARAEEATRNLRLEAERTGNSIEETFADQLARLFVGAEGGFNIGPSDDMFRKVLDAADVGLSELSDAINGTDAEWQAFVDRVVAAATKMSGSSAAGPLITDLEQLRAAQTEATHDSDALAAAQRELGVETGTTAGEMDGLAGSTAAATDRIAEQADEILGTLSARIAATDAAEAYNQSIVDVADAQAAEADAAAAVTEAEGDVEDARIAAADAAAAVSKAEAAVADARKGVATATRAVEDAEDAATQAREDHALALEELALREQEATGDSDEMRAAVKGVTEAEEELVRAQEARAVAQGILDTATANYEQTLAGLARTAGGAADDVLMAEIRLREAQQAQAELGKPGADGKAEVVTADDRLAAEIRIRDAMRAVEEARLRAAAAAEEYRRNEEAGAEASDAVVEAHKGVEEAASNEQTAEERLASARDQVTTVAEEAAARVIEAQDKVAEAIDRRAAADQRVLDAKDGVLEANARVADAVDGVEAANRRASSATDAHEAAKAKVVTAKAAVVTAHGEVEAALRKVEKAALDAALAQFELDKKTGNSRDAVQGLIDRLRTAASTMDPSNPLRQSILDTAAALDDLSGFYDVVVRLGVQDAAGAVVDAGLAIVAAAVQPRALGGPVKAGSWYLVGEEGPELWRATADGEIIPARQTKAILDGPAKDPGSSSGPSSSAPGMGSNLSDEAARTLAEYVLGGGAGLSAKQRAEGSVYLEDARHYNEGPEKYRQWSEALTRFFNGGRIDPSPSTKMAALVPQGVASSSDGIDYEKLGAALERLRPIQVDAPIDARGIQSPDALVTMLAARLGLELRTDFG